MFKKKQHWPRVSTGRDEASEPCVTHHGRTSGEQFAENLTADVQHAINKCESLGPGQQLILHGNPSAIAATFSPLMAILRRHFLPKMHFQCYMLLQGTLGGDFDVFAASGKSTAWVLLWKNPFKTNWREGLSCSPIQLFAAGHLIRVSGQRLYSGRKTRDVSRQLITPENEGGEETSSPSPPNIPSLMVLMFFFVQGLVDLFINIVDPYPEPQNPPDQPGFPPGLPPAPPPAGGERNTSGGSIA